MTWLVALALAVVGGVVIYNIVRAVWSNDR